MTSPGVTVKPLYAFNGKRLWNQVFFEDVRVPMSQRLGDEDRGWTVAKSLLGDERLMVSRVAENRRILANLRETLEHQLSRGSAVLDAARKAVNELDIRLQALETTSLRILTAFDGGGDIGAEPSMLKLKGSELVQAQDEVLFTLIDYLALPLDTATGGAAVTPELGRIYRLRPLSPSRIHHCWWLFRSSTQHHCQAGPRPVAVPPLVMPIATLGRWCCLLGLRHQPPYPPVVYTA